MVTALGTRDSTTTRLAPQNSMVQLLRLKEGTRVVLGASLADTVRPHTFPWKKINGSDVDELRSHLPPRARLPFTWYLAAT